MRVLKIFKILKILSFAVCLMIAGAFAPQPEMLYGGDPDAIMEVFVTKECNSFSGGISGFISKVISGKWKKINFDYCPCIPMDIGEASNFTDILNKAWSFITSIPAGFWKGEFDLGMQTKKPQLEDTQKKVWAEAWKADALTREMEIQEAAMLVNIALTRASVYIDAYNAAANQLGKVGMYNTDRDSDAFKRYLLKANTEFPIEASEYNKVRPLKEVMDSYLNRWKEIHPASILAMHDGAAKYSNIKSAMDKIYNDLLDGDGGSDALGGVAELVNNVSDVISKIQSIKSFTDIAGIISSVTGVIDALKNFKIGSLSYDKRMLFAQVVDALLDDVVKNWKMWVAAVLDKNPLYPLNLVKDSFLSVVKDLALMLMIIPPTKGQTKELQLVMEMLDHQGSLIELNEMAVHKFIDLGTWGPQAGKTMKRWGKENVTRISHNATQYKQTGTSRKFGF